jgi:aryl-alcohol dehydrogenase-like predicted oxidoreductase
MTLGQAALRWILADDHVATTLPNIYGAEQIGQFAAAGDARDLTAEELAEVAALYERNFDLAAAG